MKKISCDNYSTVYSIVSANYAIEKPLIISKITSTIAGIAQFFVL
jgi:hypothetical protein